MDSVMIINRPPSKRVRSKKRKREVDEASPSVEAVSGKSLMEMVPTVLARWKTTTYKGNSVTRKLAEILTEIENATFLGTEEDFKPQKANAKRGSISGQIWEVEIDKEWISSRHQVNGNQVASDPLERGLTRHTARPWWIALDIAKEIGLPKRGRK